MQRVMAISASAAAGLAIAAWGGEIWLTSSIPVAHLARFGRMAGLKRTKELDPLRPLLPVELGAFYWWEGRYDDALDEVCNSLELNADFPSGLFLLGSMYAAKGMYEEAIAAHEKAGAASPDWDEDRRELMEGRREEGAGLRAPLPESSPTPAALPFCGGQRRVSSYSPTRGSLRPLSIAPPPSRRELGSGPHLCAGRPQG